MNLEWVNAPMHFTGEPFYPLMFIVLGVSCFYASIFGEPYGLRIGIFGIIIGGLCFIGAAMLIAFGASP